MKKKMYTVILAGIILYLSLAAVLYLLQGRLLYIPFREIAVTPDQVGIAYEEHRLTAADGKTLAAWWLPVENSRGVLLFCHGNAGNISHRLYPAQLFQKLGLSVLLFDYRGYGKSQGEPSEEGTYLDADAAWRFLREHKGIPPEKVLVFGESLGGAVAADLAWRCRPAGLILQSTFTSIPELAGKLYPLLPGRWLSRFQYRTIDKIGGIACPKLIVHSREDEIVPFSHGRALFEKAAEPKHFLEIRGTHNETLAPADETYPRDVERFLRTVFP